MLLTAPAVNASAEAQTAAAVRSGAVELHFAPTENLERIDLGLLGTAPGVMTYRDKSHYIDLPVNGQTKRVWF